MENRRNILLKSTSIDCSPQALEVNKTWEIGKGIGLFKDKNKEKITSRIDELVIGQ